jgi:hypothetical protein
MTQYIKINSRNRSMLFVKNVEDADMEIVNSGGNGDCFFNSLAKHDVCFIFNGELYNLNDSNKVKVIRRLRYVLQNLIIRKYKTVENYNILSGEAPIKTFDIITATCGEGHSYYMNDLIISLFITRSNLDIIIINSGEQGLNFSTFENVNDLTNSVPIVLIRMGDHYNTIVVKNHSQFNVTYGVLFRRNISDSMVKLMRALMFIRPFLKGLYNDDFSQATLVIDIMDMVEVFSGSTDVAFEYFRCCCLSYAKVNKDYIKLKAWLRHIFTIADINNLILIASDSRVIECFEKIVNRMFAMNICMADSFKDIERNGELLIVYVNNVDDVVRCDGLIVYCQGDIIVARERINASYDVIKGL